MRLAGKAAVVTGAANGIGLAIARAMAAEGAHVFMGDIDDEAGRAAAQEICEAGGKATYARCDVSADAEMKLLIDRAVCAAGRIDILVNNAAAAIGGMPIHEMKLDQWHRLIAVNLTSVFSGCRHALTHMVEARRGSIVNIASAQGHVGLEGWAAYAGAKGAIMAMTRQMAVEYGPFGIRVNSISPGTIATPMNRKLADELGEHVLACWAYMHPVGRIGEPGEVAEAAVYLGSDAAGFTTGIDLRVDGGLCITPRLVPQLFEPKA